MLLSIKDRRKSQLISNSRQINYWQRICFVCCLKIVWLSLNYYLFETQSITRMSLCFLNSFYASNKYFREKDKGFVNRRKVIFIYDSMHFYMDFQQNNKFSTNGHFSPLNVCFWMRSSFVDNFSLILISNENFLRSKEKKTIE